MVEVFPKNHQHFFSRSKECTHPNALEARKSGSSRETTSTLEKENTEEDK